MLAKGKKLKVVALRDKYKHKNDKRPAKDKKKRKGENDKLATLRAENRAKLERKDAQLADHQDEIKHLKRIVETLQYQKNKSHRKIYEFNKQNKASRQLQAKQQARVALGGFYK
jgi:hypothetical protein